ncbi:hypothetical protein HD554DRAFT_1990434, partial [Boletus coccyginus]
GRNLTQSSIFCSHHPPHVRFLPEDDPDAFGFLNPDVVIQGVHLIPSFSEGQTSGLLVGHSIAQQASEGNNDWVSFNVNIFVDRDMVMQYRGGSVGHAVTRHWDDFLQSDNRTIQKERAVDDDDDQDED